MSKSSWVAVQYRFGSEKQILSMPIFGELMQMSSGELRFYSGGGPSYFCPDETFSILKSYPLDKPGDENQNILAAEVRFARDFPLAPTELSPRTEWNPVKGKETENIEGWLSPDGAYYAHGLGLHVSTGHHLALQLFGSSDGADHLRDQGWLSIHDGGYIRAGKPVTAEQSSGLQRLAQMVQENLVRRHLERAAARA